MDRVFRQQGILPQQITTMDRLAYTGLNMEALEYLPASDYRSKTEDNQIVIQKAIESIQDWDSVAQELAISVSTRKFIQKQLDEVWKANQAIAD